MGQCIIPRRGGSTMKVTKLTPSDVTVSCPSNAPHAYVYVPKTLFTEGAGYYTVELNCRLKGTTAVKGIALTSLSTGGTLSKVSSNELNKGFSFNVNSTQLIFNYSRDSSGDSFEFIDGFILFHQ